MSAASFTVNSAATSTSPRDYRLLGWLALILATAFAGIAVAGYLHTRNVTRHLLLHQAMPQMSEVLMNRIRAAEPKEGRSIVDPEVVSWLAPANEVAVPGQRAYFIDATGKMLDGGYAIRDTVGLHVIADHILNHKPEPTRLSYEQGGATILLSSRYLPGLDWYLVLERNLQLETRTARRLLFVSLAIGAACTLLALALVAWGASRYQRRVERLAAADPLTGLPNDHSFDILLDQSVRDMQRTEQALSLIRFELDSLDTITDTDGHLLGEHVLYTVAQLANKVIRGNDILARWSGAGFIILLRDCPLEIAARTAETLLNAVASHGFDVSLRITVSAGVAECGAEELPVGLLQRAEQALREARSRGTNQLAVAASGKPAHAGSPLYAPA